MTLTCESIPRVANIVRTAECWFSKFHHQNDPMEGVFFYYPAFEKLAEQITNHKNLYTICSFGNSENNPILWAYYTGGFRGVSIGISIDQSWEKMTKKNSRTGGKKLWCKVVYKKQAEFESAFSEVEAPESIAKKLISQKLDFWKPESEIRLIYQNAEPGLVEVGKIISLTFGCNIPLKKIECLINQLKEADIDAVAFNIASPNSEKSGDPVSIEKIEGFEELKTKFEEYHEWRSRFTW